MIQTINSLNTLRQNYYKSLEYQSEITTQKAIGNLLGTLKDNPDQARALLKLLSESNDPTLKLLLNAGEKGSEKRIQKLQTKQKVKEEQRAAIKERILNEELPQDLKTLAPLMMLLPIIAAIAVSIFEHRGS